MQSFSLPSVTDVPLRILLVEDSRADADLLVEMLEDELGDAVITVCPSMAAATPLLAGPLDIVITDLSLPDAEGLQALTQILGTRPDIAVVVMTGRADRQLALQALSAGAEDYLVKGADDARGVATAVLYAAHRHSAEEKAHRYERLALDLLDAMEAATCAVDPAGNVIAVNRAWRDFAVDNDGHPVGTGVGANYFLVCEQATPGPEGVMASAVERGLRDVLEGRQARFEGDYPCHSSTEERWFSVRINPLPGAGAVLSHVDVSAAKKSERALSHLAMHDALTGLPNRDLLTDRLGQALAWSGRAGASTGVAFLDVDQFKSINDSHGHAAGDELLRAIAARLRTDLRDGDTLSRYAGDEFVVVWQDVDGAADAERMAQRLTRSLRAPFRLTATTLAVTVSIGVAVGAAPQTADELLLAADAAMYDAKASGRGGIRMYTEELRQDLATRLRIEGELHTGLREEQFVLHYQPVVDVRHGKVTGVEALVRWAHPDGLRQPDTFIPVAEATGLIVPLGNWVLGQACRQAVRWSAEGLDLVMAVNFSARQISHPDVLAGIRAALRASGLAPSRLLAEVTESTVMEDAERAQVALRQIAELGVDVAIDDFGTGYSSLLYLKRYPIGVLKIDRNFVAGLGVRDDDDAIVASVIGLARAVGAVCIAEGVETTAQHHALQALGCDHAQGYLYGRPVPAEQLPAAVEQCRLVLPQLSSRVQPARAPVPVPVPAPLLLRIREMHAAGGSLHTIAAALNAEDHRQPSGRRWHSTSVAKVVAQLPR